MLNALWAIRFELLLTAAALGIGALGLWHEYSTQKRIAHLTQNFKDRGQLDKAITIALAHGQRVEIPEVGTLKLSSAP